MFNRMRAVFAFLLAVEAYFDRSDEKKLSNSRLRKASSPPGSRSTSSSDRFS
jgi:hypothetical protein